MPFDAEPKNGDFAAYVDRLVNQGGQAPGAGMSTEAWAAKASAQALAKTKPAGFPTGHGTASGPGSHRPGSGQGKARNKDALAGMVPGASKLPGANPNAWGRSGSSTVPMNSVPSSPQAIVGKPAGLPIPAPGAIGASARFQEARDTLAFIIKQFNSRRS
jgi:hypothetical protein